MFPLVLQLPVGEVWCVQTWRQPPPQEQLENDIATSFAAFQRHTFDEDHSDPILQGIFFFFPSGLKADHF